MKSIKKILIIDGHPYGEGTVAQLAVEYSRGARETGHKVKFIRLREIDFDLNLHNGYKEEQPLESDLESAWKKVRWADHVVVLFPIWWGSMPALTKGFFDRILLPGSAYKFRKGSLLQKKLLKGRSARVVYTQGGPMVFSNILLRDSSWVVIKNYIFKFVGFSPVKRTFFDWAGRSSAKTEMESWKKEVYFLGKKGK
jgi:NAD(P)H dehydrogenase (quinone)